MEINTKNSTIYKGTFDKGHKLGHFTVVGPEEQYEGYLHKGKYNGRGKLTTNVSVYEGTFYNGCRHGYGEELFLKSGLKLTGYFNMDRFSNQNNSRTERNTETKNKRLIKNERERPKLTNILQFSFHDDSDEEVVETPRERRRRRRHPEKIGFEVSSLIESAEEDSPLPSYFRRLLK